MSRRHDVASSFSFVGADKKRVASRIKLPVVRAAGQSSLELVELLAFREAALAGCSD